MTQIWLRCELTIFEGTLAELSGFLLELFDGTLIDTTTFVDEMTSGRGFSGVDVTDDCDKISVLTDVADVRCTYRQR